MAAAAAEAAREAARAARAVFERAFEGSAAPSPMGRASSPLAIPSAHAQRFAPEHRAPLSLHAPPSAHEQLVAPSQRAIVPSIRSMMLSQSAPVVNARAYARLVLLYGLRWWRDEARLLRWWVRAASFGAARARRAYARVLSRWWERTVGRTLLLAEGDAAEMLGEEEAMATFAVEALDELDDVRRGLDDTLRL